MIIVKWCQIYELTQVTSFAGGRPHSSLILCYRITCTFTLGVGQGGV